MTAGLHRLTVPPEARGERLDQHLSRVLPDLSRSRIQALVEEGRVQVDARVAKAAQRLRGGESVLVEVPEPRAAVPVAQDLPLRILLEDRELVVVDKAPGMVVHPAAGNWDGTLINALLFRVKDLGGVGGELRPGLVHRLDKDTSGCLVIAKNERSLAALQAAFKARDVDKRYLALVHGSPPDSAQVETLYGRHPKNRLKFTGRVKEGKPALTRYETKERFDGAALVEVELLTGRTHQIRVHLAEAGFPLLGDELYGGTKRGKGRVAEAQAAIGRQALHALRLSFPHPKTGRRRAVEAPLPEDFERALAVLRGG